MNDRNAIAIVGMACRYPDADSPTALWENVMAQRRAFRRIPSERLRLEDYQGTKDGPADSTYAMQAALLTNWEFDRVGFRVAGGAYRAADLAHWLALEVASGALADAGFDSGDLPQDATGVIVGNTLTGEFSRANSLRLRWPYVRRVVDAALRRDGRGSEDRSRFLSTLETEYKSPFAPMNEESLAGGLSNTIAGRICNHFDLHGGGYTVDGACASSLLAVTTACSALVAGDLDVALAGGVDLSLDPFELVGFARAGALAADEMRVYDARSAGFWPGEGCGFVVLMRASEALAQGRKIYAILRGWGVSSDGSGGITRPEVEGQLLALKRAYARAGFGADTVGYFEGHGTGTAVGDATEIEALSRARRSKGSPEPPAALSSVKANIGHTKAAAGVAGLIKATMAIHSQTIPPTTGCEEPAKALSGDAPLLRVLREAEAWPEPQPIRAAVSAMGFGGINSHIVLEGAEPNRKRARLTTHEQQLNATPQDAELFLLSADSPDALRQQVTQLISVAERMARAEMADLASHLATTGKSDATIRAALVASRPEQLAASLQTLDGWLSAGETRRLDTGPGIFLASGDTAPRLGLLFPGQGTVPDLNGGALCRCFPVAGDILRQSGPSMNADLRNTAAAQPAIVSAEAAGMRILEDLGICGDVTVGHSLGELTALHWAGVFDLPALLRIATVRGRAMADCRQADGAMAALAADTATVVPLLEGLPMVVLAGLNSPRQTVVSGEAAGIARVMELARSRGISARQLSVSHAFHSPLVAPAVPALRDALNAETFEAPRRAVCSTITGNPLAADADVRALLCQQVTTPVRFIEAFAEAGDVDLWIEVGPGNVLSGLASQMTGTPTISLEATGPSLRGLLLACGAAFALGAPVKAESLFADRFVRPFRLDTPPRFLQNPCERAPLPDDEVTMPARLPEAAHDTETARRESPVPVASLSAREIVRQVLMERTEFPAERIPDDARMLSDLHLNSILVSQVVVESARRFGVEPLVSPTEAADATVAQIAAAMEAAPPTHLRRVPGGDEKPHSEAIRLFPGLDTWVRAFTVDWVKSASPEFPHISGPANWRVIAPPDCRMADDLRRSLLSCPGDGIAVCLPASMEDTSLEMLLAVAKETMNAPEGTRLLLVQEGKGASAFAKSLHLEAPHIPVAVVEVPFDAVCASEWAAQEAYALTSGFVEARYNRTGERYTPLLRLLPEPDAESPTAYPVSSQDVILVTGGGKGITAECALELAHTTGARLALVGRADPAHDTGLRANLERMAATGITFRYFTADVTDPAAIRRAIKQATAEIGPISGVLHGAGQNTPRRLADLTEEDVVRTLATKVTGLRNVLDALPVDDLRLLVTFGSIIGRMGFRGNADYALANEWLRHETEEFAAAHSTCRCRTLEWSVWAGVGMGERLGATDALMREGVVPISIDEGVRQFRHLVSSDLPGASVVVTGRFGNPPTLTIADTESLLGEHHGELRVPTSRGWPQHRFLEQVRAFYPGLELVADASVSADTDPYLTDHTYQGERLLPGVLGLEAMAQAAMTLVDAHCPPVFEAVTFRERIAIPASGTNTLRVVAQVQADGSVRIVLRSSATGFHVDHFGAICRFDGCSIGDETVALETSESCADTSAACDLYGSVLFHGPRFQRIRGYRRLRARECAAEIGPPVHENDAWFGEGLTPSLCLGDPGARDAYLHAIQACLPHKILLPVGVERIEITCPMNSGYPRLLRARERSQDGDRYTYDMEVLGADGRLLERWHGLQLQAMTSMGTPCLPAGSLLGPFLERRLEELLPGCPVSLVAGRAESDETARGERSDSAIRRLLGPDAKVTRRPDGKPEMNGSGTVAGNISATHSGALTLVVARDSSVACDMEPVQARPIALWRDLLGPERFSLAELLARTDGEAMDMAAARVWTAMECLTKAGLPSHAPLTREKAHGRGGIVFASGDKRIASLIVPTVGEGPGTLAVAVLMETVDRAYEYRHIVSFEETNLVGNVYYTNHLLWQGRCREMFLYEHAPDVLTELRQGLALVTTGVSCRYLAELSAFDEIVLRMRLASLTESELSLTFEYLRVGSNDSAGNKEVIARGEQQLACMRREGERLIPTPIPRSLREALIPFRGGQ